MSRIGLARLSAATIAAAIGLGAMGAHLMKDRLAEGGEELWRTGSLYLALTGLGIGLLAAWSGNLVRDRVAWRIGTVAWFGSALFAVTLYGLALGGPRWLGAVTPLGGATMIGSWIVILFQAGRDSTSPQQ
ncbi:MAG: DUF423 domain-containing protein [Fimbriimonadaceae bacterium]